MRADATSTVHHVFARIREEEKGIEGPGRCGGGRGGQGTGGRRCGESVREARRTWHHDALHGKQGVRWVTCARGGELACTCGVDPQGAERRACRRAFCPAKGLYGQRRLREQHARRAAHPEDVETRGTGCSRSTARDERQSVWTDDVRVDAVMVWGGLCVARGGGCACGRAQGRRALGGRRRVGRAAIGSRAVHVGVRDRLTPDGRDAKVLGPASGCTNID